ncbi:hypothetical protein L3X38_010804 [Prunus dulcis]|uniref:SWIM-type domain-containing protein n=1 Tax=Prunus dulcis TaxID=3755 RepID=A0AAD4WGZ4_PRUDU|nr:hypothetical protein L3X38_010804 [Prunus dulcis]
MTASMLGSSWAGRVTILWALSFLNLSWRAKFRPKQSHRFGRMYCGNGLFQVGDTLVDQHSFNLWTRTCSCRRWVLNGIPCMHAVSAIFHNRQEAEQFVDKCYTPEAYLRAYSPVIHPVKSMKYWPKEAT